MENVVQKSDYTLTYGKLSLVVEGNHDLERIVKDNIGDFRMRRMVEAQFCNVTLVTNGRPVTQRIGFPREIRMSLAQWWEEEQVRYGGEPAPAGKPEQGRSVVKTRPLKQLELWLILKHFGFDGCSTINPGLLPEFDDNGRPTKTPQRSAIGAPIKCFQVDFTCDMFQKRDGLDMERDLIALLPEGLFLDSHCKKSGCTVYLSTMLPC